MLQAVVYLDFLTYSPYIDGAIFTSHHRTNPTTGCCEKFNLSDGIASSSLVLGSFIPTFHSHRHLETYV